MNEVFDKLLIRVLFTVFICLALIGYKYAHMLFHPSQKKSINNKIFPHDNYIFTIHFFSRLIGIGLIFSAFEFKEYLGVFISSFHFFLWSALGIFIYLLSIFTIESIIFYNFEYKDEVLKKNNLSYGLISATNTITLAFVIRCIFKESENSIIILTILWLTSMVLIGFGIKLFKFISDFSFNSYMIQKSTSIGISFSGFLIGNTIIITTTLTNEHYQITSYLIQIILKCLLSVLILPLFRFGLLSIFKINSSKTLGQASEQEKIGHSCYECSIYITSSLLASIVIGQIHFGTIYPFF